MILNKSGGLSNKQLLIKNTFWLSAIEFFSKILMFVVTVSLVRYWGIDEFGKFNLSFAYVAVFMIFSDFGLDTITIRDVAKNKDLTEKYLSNLIGLKLFLAVLIMVLFVLSFLFVNNPVSMELLVVTLLYSVLQTFQGVFLAIFQAWEKMELVFVTKLIFYIGILFSALFVIKTNGYAFDLVLGYILVVLMVIVLGIKLIKSIGIKIKISFDFNFWGKLIKETLPLFGMTAATIIYTNSDTLIIGRYFGSNQVGWYQTAYKILFAFQSVNVINYAILPRISILFHEDKKETIKKLLRLIISLSIFGLVFLATLITWQRELIMRLIYGETLTVAAGVMSLLVWSGVINYFRNLVGNLLVVRKKQSVVFWAVLVGATVNLVVNWLMVPKFGFICAGWSLVISESVILMVMILGFKKKGRRIK